MQEGGSKRLPGGSEAGESGGGGETKDGPRREAAGASGALTKGRDEDSTARRPRAGHRVPRGPPAPATPPHGVEERLGATQNEGSASADASVRNAPASRPPPKSENIKVLMFETMHSPKRPDEWVIVVT